MFLFITLTLYIFTLLAKLILTFLFTIYFPKTAIIQEIKTEYNYFNLLYLIDAVWTLLFEHSIHLFVQLGTVLQIKIPQGVSSKIVCLCLYLLVMIVEYKNIQGLFATSILKWNNERAVIFQLKSHAKC